LKLSAEARDEKGLGRKQNGGPLVKKDGWALSKGWGSILKARPKPCHPESSKRRVRPKIPRGNGTEGRAWPSKRRAFGPKPRGRFFLPNPFRAFGHPFALIGRG
jgi:hypothetical protein